MTKNYRARMDGSKVLEILKIVGISLFLANIAVSEFWLEELLIFSDASHQSPDVVIFPSIFFFFIVVVAFFFNRLQALVFAEVPS